jgi:large subunit ribosomal protein L35
MPKMKTHKGAAARFKVTGSGKLRRRSQGMNHILEKKSPTRRRRLNRVTEVSAADAPRIKRQLGL